MSGFSSSLMSSNTGWAKMVDDKKEGECFCHDWKVCTGKGTWRPDPYAEEVHEIEEYHFICDACYQELCDDI